MSIIELIDKLTETQAEVKASRTRLFRAFEARDEAAYDREAVILDFWEAKRRYLLMEVEAAEIVLDWSFDQ